MGDKVADVFIPQAVLNEIVKGSYEDIVESVAELVEQKPDTFGAAQASVVATFPGYVIVATDKGEFWRAKYALHEGSLAIKRVEPVKLPTVRREDLGSYLKKEARALVENMLASVDPDVTRTRLHDLAQAIIAGARVTAERIEEAVKERLGTERAWKQAVRDNLESIRKFAGAELAEAESKLPKSKFQAIIDGSIGEDEYEKYREVALESLGLLVKRVNEVVTLAEAAHRDDYTLKAEFRTQDSDYAVADYVAFLKDFTDDVRGLQENLVDALAAAKDQCLLCAVGIHDAVASNMPMFETAAAFIRTYSTRFEG